MFYFNNTTIAAMTREPKDEQLCNPVYIYIKYVIPKPLDINKKSKSIDTTALHNMGTHLGSQN